MPTKTRCVGRLCYLKVWLYEAENPAALTKVIMCTSGLAVIMVSINRTIISTSLKERSINMKKKMHEKLEMLRKHLIQQVDLPTIRAQSIGPPWEPEMRSKGLLKVAVTGLLHTNPSRNSHNWSMYISHQLWLLHWRIYSTRHDHSVKSSSFKKKVPQ